MTAIESINTGFYPAGVSEKLDNINKQLKDLPKVLDKETLENFQKGEYDITLKEYTDMNTYRTTMTALYGNSSANKFNSAINNYLGIKSDKTATAKEFIEKLEDKGVQVGYVTLNVGIGTFRPVKCDNILDHHMDSEVFEIRQETADLINRAKADGKKLVAVGTTTVRTLESAYKMFGKIQACKGASELFIYPPYKFGVVDKLITNFHLPKSTLLMLVSALAGKDFIFEAYKEAIKEKYRFYSYGDCMFIN